MEKVTGFDGILNRDGSEDGQNANQAAVQMRKAAACPEMIAVVSFELVKTAIVNEAGNQEGKVDGRMGDEGSGRMKRRKRRTRRRKRGG